MQSEREADGRPGEHRRATSPYHLHTFTILSSHVPVGLLRERNLSTVTDAKRLFCMVGRSSSVVPAPRDTAPGGLAERHPELSSEAVEALVWDFSYAHW